MSMAAAKTGQVSKSSAEIYDEFFVPALFGPWAVPLCDASGVSPGTDVLDVACGTGATTRVAASRLSGKDRIVGYDRNEGMLEVARKRAPDIEWTEGLAEALPFADDTFDTVLCQFGLMFFEDRSLALKEMKRVLRPGGRIGVTVWDSADNSPGYAGMIHLIDTMFGADAADALRMPFVLGDMHAFKTVLPEGGLDSADVMTMTGAARFASIREWVRMDVRGWTLADLIDDAGFEALVEAAEEQFGEFAAEDGTVEFPAPAHIAVWRDQPSQNV